MFFVKMIFDNFSVIEKVGTKENYVAHTNFANIKLVSITMNKAHNRAMINKNGFIAPCV